MLAATQAEIPAIFSCVKFSCRIFQQLVWSSSTLLFGSWCSCASSMQGVVSLRNMLPLWPCLAQSFSVCGTRNPPLSIRMLNLLRFWLLFSWQPVPLRSIGATDPVFWRQSHKNTPWHSAMIWARPTSTPQIDRATSCLAALLNIYIYIQGVQIFIEQKNHHCFFLIVLNL